MLMTWKTDESVKNLNKKNTYKGPIAEIYSYIHECAAIKMNDDKTQCLQINMKMAHLIYW